MTDRFTKSSRKYGKVNSKSKIFEYLSASKRHKYGKKDLQNRKLSFQFTKSNNFPIVASTLLWVTN